MIEAAWDDGAVEIRGAVRTEPTAQGLLPRRFGAEASRRIVDDFMRAALTQSAGVRLAFRTDARRVELRVLATKLTESPTDPLPSAVYDLTSAGVVVATASSQHGARAVFSFERPQTVFLPGAEETLVFELDGVDRDYELWLPYTDEVELRALRADAAIAPPRAAPARRWVHHGSSISHGYTASRTTATWPVVAARAAAVDLTNLAYSGNAVLDQSTARTLRDTPADVISVKLGINIVNGDLMRLRVFRSAVHGFLDTIRDGHPDTPILVVSPVCCPPVEALPGPTVFEPGREPAWAVTAGRADELAQGKLSLQVIRHELAALVAARTEEDANIHHLDGSQLYGVQDNARLPMPDNLHPADDVHALIGGRFAALALAPGGPLGAKA